MAADVSRGKYGKRHKSNAWIGLPFGSASGPVVSQIDRAGGSFAGFLTITRY